ncbi:MAG: signal recognition particle-docking protein FtsY [Candidatus Gastranaerophilales bacterium]|nr:signal recognition particle-docking protein FtsY [Candidatus Gastranaerophilales bacterium]
MFEFFKKKNNAEQENQAEQKETELKNETSENAENTGFSFSFESLKSTIANTAKNLVQSVTGSVEDKEEFDEFALDDMEEQLIKADVGVNTAAEITDKLREKNTRLKPSEIKTFLKNEFDEIIKSAGSEHLTIKDGLNIYLITGVNGAGKTTLIAKLAYQFKQQGKKVLVAAGDTFRAAAEEQLNIWSERAGADIVRKDGIDAAAVTFDAIKKAQNENYDILLIDTAGRLQNKHNLMEELNKITNVINKLAPDNFTESLLVIDANTGQNGLSQAKIFKEAANLTGIALTKLDGSAKGGIIIAIAKELAIPVKLIGVGEKITDLKYFNAQDFTRALFE